MAANALTFRRSANARSTTTNSTRSSNNHTSRSRSGWAVIRIMTTIVGCSMLVLVWWITTLSTIQHGSSGRLVIGDDATTSTPTRMDNSPLSFEATQVSSVTATKSKVKESSSSNHAADDEAVVTASSAAASAINFRLDPRHFVDKLVDCIIMGQHNDAANNNNNKNRSAAAHCHILYLHTGKTGGQDLESKMWKLFVSLLPSLHPKAMRRSCCGPELVAHFDKHSHDYCHAKFSAYEVDGASFVRDIVPTCMGHYNGDNDASPASAAVLVLATFREPIQRTLSYIHQMCNKNFRKRSRETQRACTRCAYSYQNENNGEQGGGGGDGDVDFWNGVVASANDNYQDLWSALQSLLALQGADKSGRRITSDEAAAAFANMTAAAIATRTATIEKQQQQQQERQHQPRALDVLTIDTEDLTSMYGHLHHRLLEVLRQLGEHEEKSQHGGDRTKGATTPRGNDTLTVASTRAFAQSGSSGAHTNRERTSRCNFALTSPMLRGLRPSLQIYRNMTLNGM